MPPLPLPHPIPAVQHSLSLSCHVHVWIAASLFLPSSPFLLFSFCFAFPLLSFSSSTFVLFLTHYLFFLYVAVVLRSLPFPFSLPSLSISPLSFTSLFIHFSSGASSSALLSLLPFPRLFSSSSHPPSALSILSSCRAPTPTPAIFKSNAFAPTSNPPINNP